MPLHRIDQHPERRCLSTSLFDEDIVEGEAFGAGEGRQLPRERSQLVVRCGRPVVEVAEQQRTHG
jgi:hypothetical protein